MSAGPSLLSIAAVGLYGAVAMVCGLAAATAARHRQMPWHMRGWALIGLLFCGFIVLRLLDIEEVLQDQWRDTLRAQGAYDGRRAYQRPLAAGVIAMTVAASFWWIHRVIVRVNGRRNLAIIIAASACFGMIVLIVLRLISLHPVDSLLYGPLKLNWLVDLGTSMAVMGCAGVYVRVVGRRQ